MSTVERRADVEHSRLEVSFGPKGDMRPFTVLHHRERASLASLSRIRRDPKRHRPCSPACADGTSREKIQIPAAVAGMASAEATLTALSSPTSGSEGNLRTHRECVEPGAGVSAVGRADLLGDVAVQVVKHETNV